MKTFDFDELKNMNDLELTEYLEQEIENVIQSAPPKRQLSLRALQAKINGIKHKYRNLPPNILAGMLTRQALDSQIDMVNKWIKI
jgi:hypothetical protein